MDIALLARESGVSEYHLKRTFRFLAGVSIPEYVKYRRLALANEALVKGKSVTSVAFLMAFKVWKVSPGLLNLGPISPLVKRSKVGVKNRILLSNF